MFPFRLPHGSYKNNGTIRVIDVGGSYKKLTRMLGGKSLGLNVPHLSSTPHGKSGVAKMRREKRKRRNRKRG